MINLNKFLWLNLQTGTILIGAILASIRLVLLISGIFVLKNAELNNTYLKQFENFSLIYEIYSFGFSGLIPCILLIIAGILKKKFLLLPFLIFDLVSFIFPSYYQNIADYSISVYPSTVIPIYIINGLYFLIN